MQTYIVPILEFGLEIVSLKSSRTPRDLRRAEIQADEALVLF